MNPRSTKIKITLPSSTYFVSGIRDFTLNLIKNTTHFAEKWSFRFQSVVDELCNNAIELGSNENTDIEITFDYKENEFLEIEVKDTGKGKDPKNAAAIKKTVEERRDPNYKFTGLRGRGLAKIVSEWTDELEFIDNPEGGITVRVRKYLKDPRFKSGLPESTPTHLVLNV
jgi:anti-sigma regulatory factor (Ser/Thr protein kinase)